MSGGKSGADYIRDLFRTLVLRPLLQPVGNAMAGVIGQLPGAGGGSGLLGQVGQMAHLSRQPLKPSNHSHPSFLLVSVMISKLVLHKLQTVVRSGYKGEIVLKLL